jgi:hypothetical protein
MNTFWIIKLIKLEITFNNHIFTRNYTTVELQFQWLIKQNRGD